MEMKDGITVTSCIRLMIDVHFMYCRTYDDFIIHCFAVIAKRNKTGPLLRSSVVTKSARQLGERRKEKLNLYCSTSGFTTSFVFQYNLNKNPSLASDIYSKLLWGMELPAYRIVMVYINELKRSAAFSYSFMFDLYINTWYMINLKIKVK
ncbi:hypothetical protein LOAG_03364 [Loa loa]|uniref:Uncharacterized protein n=1 Tax=Loa loa TaxID=7209 RepID=A0A1S0U4V0_LOALO|nr:hypothetical protein LOAG_03364 [Loa loa]EFO25120.1 hypothetical protein LOAG_03364 [Loa loa]